MSELGDISKKNQTQIEKKNSKNQGEIAACERKNH